MISAVPGISPLTKPVAETTGATVGLALLQKPVPVRSLNVVVDPTHTFVVPVITAGSGLTVTAMLVLQPVGKV